MALMRLLSRSGLGPSFTFASFTTEAKSCILIETKSCGIIILNRPKVLNSLNVPMIRQIYPQLKKWNENPRISHVIIEGSGGRAFCAGGDVRALVEVAKTDVMLCQAFFREEYQLNHLIGTLSKPFIALIDGVTMGGGVGLSVHGKYRVATEKTLFSMPETAIGLFPDVGGGYFLPRLPFPGLGAFLALTGHRLNGLEVLWAGVATHYRPSNEIETLKEALCRLEFPAITCASDISKINKGIVHLLDARTKKPVAPVSLAPHMDAIGTIFALFESGAAVTVEDILRKLEIYSKTGTANKEWAETYINILNRMSPTSLKITLRQLQEGSKLSFADNFKMEFRLSQHCVRRPDLAEGIRATLIDKDGSPRWDPPHLSLVTKELVDSYFSPIPGVPEWCI